MKTFNYTITDALGIHARPAGLLVKEATKFTSEINLTKDGKTASAKKIFAIMSLAVKSGQEVTLTINGPDENQASEAILTFFKENL